MLALTTGTPEHKIRVIAPDVGGGFGAKLNVYAEEVALPVVAKRLGRRSSGPRPAPRRTWPCTTVATRSRTSRSRRPDGNASSA
jgi:hypothetical protein